MSQITPTGDTTGSQDTAAINSALSSGFAWLGPGTFSINAVINIPHKAALWGVGAETRVMCVGTAGFYIYDTVTGDGSDRTANSSGSIRDLIIDGTNASAGAYLLGSPVVLAMAAGVMSADQGAACGVPGGPGQDQAGVYG